MLFLCFGTFCEAKLPQITPKTVKNKMEEILKTHVVYKRFSPELAERSLINFIEELDPTKTYFIEPEIAQWIHPNADCLQRVVVEYFNSSFTVFEEIYQVMLEAIARRNRLEEAIFEIELPTEVTPSEFQNLSWAANEEALKTRLLRIKSLQENTLRKLHSKNGSFERLIDKRRLNKEREIHGENQGEREKFLLSCTMKALSCSLDSHTHYFTPAEAAQFMIQVQQKLYGIGAQLRDSLDGFTIVRLLEESPAATCNKLKVNDRIIAVSGEPVAGLDIIEAVEKIRGEKGTPVTLTVLRDSEQFEVTLVRGEVVLEETRLDTSLEPYGDGVIATLKLFSFYQDENSSSSQDIEKVVKALKKKEKLKGVILDLRGNAGGILPQAVSVTGLFITKGIVVSIKDSQGHVQHLREMGGNIVWDGPLLVLTDRASASAAEIVAGALQDYGRAILVGDSHTFGKGTFQTFTLDTANNGKVNPQGEFKVTRGKYYTVSGKSPQLHGITVDIIVPGMLAELDIGEAFAKYPLPNDNIEPHFVDDLADVPFLHRDSLAKLYRNNLQQKLSIYDPYLKILTDNSSFRIGQNKNYQAFLQEIKEKHFDAESIDLFHQSDLQYTECKNIMKDLIFLMEKETNKLAS